MSACSLINSTYSEDPDRGMVLVSKVWFGGGGVLGDDRKKTVNCGEPGV